MDTFGPMFSACFHTWTIYLIYHFRHERLLAFCNRNYSIGNKMVILLFFFSVFFLYFLYLITKIVTKLQFDWKCWLYHHYWWLKMNYCTLMSQLRYSHNLQIWIKLFKPCGVWMCVKTARLQLLNPLIIVLSVSDAVFLFTVTQYGSVKKGEKPFN